MSAVHGLCQDCRHYAALDNQCRRNPPTAQLIPNPNTGRIEVIGVWPAAAKTQWCGEFMPDKSMAQVIAGAR